jgi:gliding motility-associated protein GldM
LGNANEEAYGLDKNKAIVLADKSTFFAGEKFQGKVVIGQYAQVPPIKLNVQGQDIDLTEAIDSTGAARLDFNVGNVGEHIIEGIFTVMQKGKPLEIPITGNYVVVPRPDEASIAADKMNVVYRGLNNPLTISFAGVSDNKVTVSTDAKSSISKTSNGKYALVPKKGFVTNISATATLDDGSRVVSTKEFRIKDIPSPVGKISGKTGVVKLNKNDMISSKVLASFEDFVYDLKASVFSFDLTVSGKPSITVTSDRFNKDAVAAIRSAPKKSTVTIENIKVSVSGVALTFEAQPIIIKLTN